MVFSRLTLVGAAAVIATAPLATAAAENLTDASRAMLKEAKLSESVMSGLDKELAVPSSWYENAKKEGALRVRMQMHAREFAGTAKIFNARYPGIDLQYSRGIGKARAVGPVIAYKAGNIIAEVLSAYESQLKTYRQMDGLVKITDLPAYASMADQFKTPEGTDAANKINYWCLAYSPDRVKKADLPDTYDALLTNKRIANGKLGVPSNLGLTTLPGLWGAKGDKWYANFLDKLFNVVKPSLRKETLAAFGKMIAVKEFDVGLGIADYIVERDARKGIPVAAHCPEPIPVTYGYLGILKGSPHLYAAKLFLNWYLSKEGQIANFQYGRKVPVHRELTGKEFLPYPDEVLGKKVAYRTNEVLQKMGPKVVAPWKRAWTTNGGSSRGKKKPR